MPRITYLGCGHVENFFQCCGSGSGIRCFFGPWIRAGKKSRSRIRGPGPGSGMNIPDLIFEFFCVKNTQILRCESGFGILSALDHGSGMDNIRSGILDPGWKNRIPDPEH
jgi:hypothetical protein